MLTLLLTLVAAQAATTCPEPIVVSSAGAWGIHLGMSESALASRCSAKGWSCSLEATADGYTEATFDVGTSSGTEPDLMRVRVSDGKVFAVRALFRDDGASHRAYYRAKLGSAVTRTLRGVTRWQLDDRRAVARLNAAGTVFDAMDLEPAVCQRYVSSVEADRLTRPAPLHPAAADFAGLDFDTLQQTSATSGAQQATSPYTVVEMPRGVVFHRDRSTSWSLDLVNRSLSTAASGWGMVRLRPLGSTGSWKKLASRPLPPLAAQSRGTVVFDVDASSAGLSGPLEGRLELDGDVYPFTAQSSAIDLEEAVGGIYIPPGGVFIPPVSLPDPPTVPSWTDPDCIGDLEVHDFELLGPAVAGQPLMFAAQITNIGCAAVFFHPNLQLVPHGAQAAARFDGLQQLLAAPGETFSFSGADFGDPVFLGGDRLTKATVTFFLPGPPTTPEANPANNSQTLNIDLISDGLSPFDPEVKCAALPYRPRTEVEVRDSAYRTTLVFQRIKSIEDEDWFGDELRLNIVSSETAAPQHEAILRTNDFDDGETRIRNWDLELDNGWASPLNRIGVYYHATELDSISPNDEIDGHWLLVDPVALREQLGLEDDDIVEGVHECWVALRNDEAYYKVYTQVRVGPAVDMQPPSVVPGPISVLPAAELASIDLAAWAGSYDLYAPGEPVRTLKLQVDGTLLLVAGPDFVLPPVDGDAVGVPLPPSPTSAEIHRDTLRFEVRRYPTDPEALRFHGFFVEDGAQRRIVGTLHTPDDGRVALQAGFVMIPH